MASKMPRTPRNRGFTLVELMIVVAIIGVLAALALFGVRKYLAAAKTAEARNTIGAINRAAVTAYDRENIPSQILPGGTMSAQGTHELCDTANPVPAGGPPAGKKYQPHTQSGQDFNVGTMTAGWQCLRFVMTEATYYQYAYTKGAAFQILNAFPAPAGMSWAAEARGDLDGDGDLSEFAGYGGLENGYPKIGTEILEANIDE